MLGLTRWSPFDDIFKFQREVDRAFNQFWSDLPTRTTGMAPSFNVVSNNDEWRIDVPLPGIDPAHVHLEVADNTISIRAEEPGDSKDGAAIRYEQAFTVPPFLDIDQIRASHQHGMLRLTLPLKQSMKPRRLEIETGTDKQKQLTAA
jgi:HSP20 family protein